MICKNHAPLKKPTIYSNAIDPALNITKINVNTPKYLKLPIHILHNIILMSTNCVVITRQNAELRQLFYFSNNIFCNIS